MKIINYTDVESVSFDNEVAKGVTGRVVIGKNDGAPNFCMRLFTLAPGGYTPRHSHEWEHEILIHAGKGKIFQEGNWVAISSGHAIFIPGGDEHQFKNDSDADLVFACLIPSGIAEL